MASTQPRVWLITGASSGFGRAMAEAALAAGDTVVAAARRTAALADRVASAPERVTALTLDVTDGNRISAAVVKVAAIPLWRAVIRLARSPWHRRRRQVWCEECQYLWIY
jgi:NADP-dependent 3-hydroxy acid dehydrogenase YdfG